MVMVWNALTSVILQFQYAYLSCLGAQKMYIVITNNICPFVRALFVSRSHDLIGGQIAAEIITLQVQQMINKNRLFDRLKVKAICLLSPIKLGTFIVTVYWKS